VVFDFEMMQEDRYPTGPSNGVYTYGLFLEGARWDKDERALAESLPKVLFSPAPTMHWVPYRKAEVPKYPHYKCPVYKTSDRRYAYINVTNTAVSMVLTSVPLLFRFF
jgi:dynein heavy chain